MSNSNVIDVESRRGNKLTPQLIKKGIIFVIVIAFLLFLLSNIFIVKENEYKVVRQFGEVVKIVSKPGLHVKIPFVQSITSIPKYQMTYDIKEAEINTKDKKRMLVDNYAIWRVDDPKKLISNARSVVNAETKMGEFIFSVVRSELGKLEYDEIIDDEKSSRGSLNDQITEQVNNLLADDDYGVTVTDVRIKRTDLPQENEQSVYRRMISERETKAQEYLSMGDASKNRITAETDKEVKEMLAKAQAQAEGIRGNGEQKAAQIYNQSYAKDVKFYDLYRTLQSYVKTIDDKSVIVLPSDSPYARILMGYGE
ncbi:protease modulator HflC [Priestia koreensis]|uniref:protease modulator HflC n=1 Tax=Priestia koreensis TaxID=284581 RepID=UPI001F57861B|nr:protease modulator HflC [Priestia koreensis]MCM3002772.1 protease modulator HflC [Priestia koreensis]UNL84467.1 protease modulator HflC [Priestia koreensis]